MATSSTTAARSTSTGRASIPRCPRCPVASAGWAAWAAASSGSRRGRRMIGDPPAATAAAAFDARVPSRARRGLRRRALTLTLVCLPVAALGGAELGGYAAVSSGIQEGQGLRDRHDYAAAEAQFRALAARSGPLYLLARGDLD